MGNDHFFMDLPFGNGKPLQMEVDMENSCINCAFQLPRLITGCYIFTYFSVSFAFIGYLPLVNGNFDEDLIGYNGK